MELDLNRLNLRHLRLIHAIGQTGQLALAAERLAMTQPAASRSLSEIERRVGAPLFERRARGMVATGTGEVFLRHADIVVGQLGSAIDDLAAFRAGDAGRVRIGTVTGPAVGFVVPAVQALRREAPGAEISIDVAPSVALVDGLLRGGYDIVLARIPPEVEPRTLDIRRGRVEQLRIVARRGHPLAGLGRLGLDRLQDQTWVVQGIGTPIRDALAQAFINLDLQVLQRTVDTSSLLVTIAYLRVSDAVAPVTEEVAGLIAGEGAERIVELPLDRSIILSPFHLVTNQARTLSPICQRMLDLLAKRLASI